MAERFSEMENSSVPSKATLEERLKEYLKLKAKIETMLGIIENACAKDKSAWRKEKQDIESAHRYVFQKRLKLSGAWWKTENLKKVTTRVTGEPGFGRLLEQPSSGGCLN